MSHKMTKEELRNKIQEFLSDGGEVMQLRYADKKDMNKAQRKSYHHNNQYNSDRSKKAVERERTRESSMIFSRDERWKK